jgi:hypothetical protein
MPRPSPVLGMGELHAGFAWELASLGVIFGLPLLLVVITAHGIGGHAAGTRLPLHAVATRLCRRAFGRVASAACSCAGHRGRLSATMIGQRNTSYIYDPSGLRLRRGLLADRWRPSTPLAPDSIAWSGPSAVAVET